MCILETCKATYRGSLYCITTCIKLITVFLFLESSLNCICLYSTSVSQCCKRITQRACKIVFVLSAPSHLNPLKHPFPATNVLCDRHVKEFIGTQREFNMTFKGQEIKQREE